VNQRWKQQGDITNVPRALYLANSIRGFAFTDASSRYVEDGSFLRVRNITLSYSIPRKLLTKASISSARISLIGQNLFTFTNYSGMDPENQNTGGGSMPSLGVDYLTQPQPRIYSVALNVGF
jgi:TonB-dependent starch-binding outer membrane protein SusC